VTDTLAAIREAELAQIAQSERLAIAAVSSRYEKRLRDLEGRAELWHRHSGPKTDLLYEAMRRETDDDARFALKVEYFALWRPFRKIDAKIKRLKRRRQAALDAVRDRARQKRRAILHRVREAEATETARIEAERRERLAIEAREAAAEAEAQRIARESATRSKNARLAAERSRHRAQKAQIERQRYQPRPRPIYSTKAEQRAARQHKRAERARNRIEART
jgi:hypothetical protein